MMADEAGTSSDGASTITKDPGRDYEVFLNFRGPDSRSTVADVLYHDLCEAGAGVFYDAREIRPGEVIAEELENGIKKSKVYIPIFSPRYASSKWCLRELRLMIECWERQKKEKTIIPIFYDVDVSKDLKLKEGSLYETALKDKEMEKYGMELGRWKYALNTAAGIEGKDVNALGLTKLKELIVEDVGRKLGIQSDPEKEIDVYVGMRERREEFINCYLEPKASDVRVVTIYGVAGMGKTTLAGQVYNKLSSNYPGGVAFLSVSDVRNKFGKADTVDLQKHLISQLLQVDTSDIVDTAKGVKWIQERVKIKEKVLIVLDDLDNGDQVLKLAGETSWFSTGSRVIITTRNIGIMPEDEGFYEYKMHELKEDDARRLLCREAFKSDLLPEGYGGKILEDAVEMTGRNPKAICTLAAVLRCNNKKVLMSKLLENIKNVRLNVVSEMLMMDYEKLNKEEQAIFLDIACLFINREMGDAIYYWKAQDRFSVYEIMALENFSFIEIVDGDKLWMNRLLRDLGRNIVNDEDINNPECRSRLWSPEVALQVVRKKKGTENVVALNLGNHNGQHGFDHEQFKGFKKLKFLELNGGNFKPEDYNNVFAELIWLCWDDCPPEFGAMKLCFESLFILMLSKTQINDNWNGWCEIQEAKELKVFKCTDCHSLRKSPNFSAFRQLERLVFKNCSELIEIDQSIGDLVELKYLLLWCPKLKELPESVGNLTSLVELDISHTRFTTLPKSVLNLIRSSNVVFKHEDCGFNEEILSRLRN